MIDSWENGEKAGVSIEGIEVWSHTNYARESCDNLWNHGFYEPWSGSGGRVCYYDVDVTVDHTGPSATIAMYATINGAIRDESWAVSDVQVFVREATKIKTAIVPAIAKPIWADMLTPHYTDVYEDGTVKQDGWSSDKVLGESYSCTFYQSFYFTFLQMFSYKNYH